MSVPNRIYKYPLSRGNANVLAATQEYKCAICGSNEDKLVVDHCHSTGFVRAMLCPQCNFGLGNFKDSTRHLLTAVGYLELHNFNISEAKEKGSMMEELDRLDRRAQQRAMNSHKELSLVDRLYNGK